MIIPYFIHRDTTGYSYNSTSSRNEYVTNVSTEKIEKELKHISNILFCMCDEKIKEDILKLEKKQLEEQIEKNKELNKMLNSIGRVRPFDLKDKLK